jgi:hypothetical protein
MPRVTFKIRKECIIRKSLIEIGKSSGFNDTYFYVSWHLEIVAIIDDSMYNNLSIWKIMG